MKVTSLLTTLLTLLLFVDTAQAQQTTQLQGRVYLNDTLPAAYATLYLPQYGIGTVTDDMGNYWMDNIPVSQSVTLEYAFLGYKTEQVKLALTQPNHRYAHDHHMQEQAIQLDEVYLTPNGEDPCVYILRKVHEQGQINRTRLVNYNATCNGSMHVQDLDVLMGIMPGFVKVILHGVLRPLGINALFNYLSENEKVDVKYQYSQLWNSGKVKNSEMTILSANPTMPEKVRKQLGKFQVDDFFAKFYGEDKKFDAKKEAKKGWKLKGVIEEDGKTIDILKRIDGDSVQQEYTCYVIEDLWSVLRVEARSKEGSFSRYECRDIGGGIYLPVSYVTNPVPVDLDKMLEETKKEIEKDKAKGEKTKAGDKMLKRYEEITKNRKGCKLNVVTPYNITYSNVKLKM